MEKSSNLLLLVNTEEDMKLVKAVAFWLFLYVLATHLFCKHLKESHPISDSSSPNPHGGAYLLSS